MATRQPFLNAAEVDDLLGLPRGRALRLARSGKIPAVLLPSGDYRFPASSVERWLRTLTVGPDLGPIDMFQTSALERLS